MTRILRRTALPLAALAVLPLAAPADPPSGAAASRGADSASATSAARRAPAAAAGPARAAAPPRPLRFARLPAGWRAFDDGPPVRGRVAPTSALATGWAYRATAHGPASALPAGGLLVSAQLLRRPPRGPLPPPLDAVAPLRLRLPARPAGTLEGRPRVPEHRVARSLCGGALVLEVRVDVRAPRLTAAQRRTAERAIAGLRLPRLPARCAHGP